MKIEKILCDRCEAEIRGENTGLSVKIPRERGVDPSGYGYESRIETFDLCLGCIHHYIAVAALNGERLPIRKSRP